MLSYTFLADGSSDRALMPILNWLLLQHLPEATILPKLADLGQMPNPPKDLSHRIRTSVELFPCDLLFVHRDSEKYPREKRGQEIRVAAAEAGVANLVCVVPVRMQEAWLLLEERALRFAAGNPNGKIPLELPNRQKLEELPDPKETLKQLLLEASGLSGRRRKQFHWAASIARVTEFIEDFGKLRVLPAFIALENELKDFLNRSTPAPRR